MKTMTYLLGIVMEKKFHLLLFSINRLWNKNAKILTNLYKVFFANFFHYDKLQGLSAIFVRIFGCKYWTATGSTISVWFGCSTSNLYYLSTNFEKENDVKNERFWWIRIRIRIWFWRTIWSRSRYWCKICMPNL